MSMDLDVLRPPSDLESERAVLGSCLIDPEAHAYLTDKLQPGDWYRERHRVIWEAMGSLALRQEGIDIVTLHAELERTGKSAEVGGAAYLAELSSCTPTALHREHYAKIVTRCALNRRLVSVGGAIANIGLENPTDQDATLGQVEQLVLDLRRRRPTSKLLTPQQRANAAVDRLVALAPMAGNAWTARRAAARPGSSSSWPAGRQWASR
jgi:replicative DNA helicase